MTSRYGKQYHIPVAIQGYAEASGSVSGSSGRRCTRCQARMRRGHDQTRTLCDPCHTTMHPYQPRTPRTPTEPATTTGTDTCIWCGRRYTKWKGNQLYCSMNCSENARRVRNQQRRRTRTP